MTKTVAILGAGPVGLAAGAWLLENGMQPLFLQRGDAVGAAVRSWDHVPMFSNWRYNIDAASARRLASNEWEAPDPEVHLTGAELVRDADAAGRRCKTTAEPALTAACR